MAPQIPRGAHSGCLAPPAGGQETFAQLRRGLFNLFILPLCTNLGDVASASEAEGDWTNGLGHEAHRDLIAAVPHSLDGLAHVAVVVGHADVLRAEEQGLRRWVEEKGRGEVRKARVLAVGC